MSSREAPFSKAAKQYIEKGWDVVPLPPREKRSPPEGYTGRINKDRFATELDLQRWLNAKQWSTREDGKREPPWAYGNIALHPGRKIVIDGQDYEAIMIDVDDYKGKNGWYSLKTLEERLGPLPDTWISSARDDNRSGHRWFLVPYGFDYYGNPRMADGKAAESIEIVQHCHRYGICWPSIHPETETLYRWYKPGQLPNARVYYEGIPDVKSLAHLPEAWFNSLRKGIRSSEGELGDFDIATGALHRWANQTFNDPKPMCRTVKRALTTKLKQIKEGPDHHDPLVNGHMNLFLLGAEGHTGWLEAVRQMEKAWIDRLIAEGNNERSSWIASAEKERSRDGALRKIKGRVDAGNILVPPSDPCLAKATGSKDPISDALAEGQIRMQRRLCVRHEGKLIYIPNVGWHFWDGTRWKEDILNRISHYAVDIIKHAKVSGLRKLAESTKFPDGSKQQVDLENEGNKLLEDAKKCQSNAGVDGIVKLARSNARVAVPLSDLDTEPYLINLKNCTLDLRTGDQKPHDPKDFITRVCKANFNQATFAKYVENPEAYCPKWLKFLEEVQPDPEVRNFLATCMGLALVGTQLEHVLIILYGDGRNGKGVFEETVRYVWGDFGVSAASDLFTGNPGAHTTSQTDLMARRLAVIDETDQKGKANESLIKKMTGGGEHTARRMHQNNVRFPMTWLAVMITNNLPSIQGQNAAIWDRIVVIPFPVYFDPAHRDKNLRDRLKEEADGIFMWAYKGWLDYQESGYKFVLPQTVREAIQDYRHTHDKVQLWIDQRCQLGFGDLFRSKPDELIEDYNNWAIKEHGAEILGKKQFLEALRQKNFRHLKGMARIEGIRLNPDRDMLRARTAVE